MQQPGLPPQASASTDPRKLLEDLHGYVGIVRRGWRLIVLGILVALTAATIFLARSKTVYRATARLLVIQQGGRIQVAGGSDPLQGVQGANDSLSTHLLIIRSPVVVERAIALSGVKTASIPTVIGSMTAKLSLDASRVIDISYKGETAPDTARMIDGVIQSYNRFLKDNYQKNTNEVITLIVKARDELNEELLALEQKYMEYRQKNPAYSADDKGRTFISRRLDQWDQTMNQLLARSLQLNSQLDLGRKLADEGVDPATISSALNQFGGLGGGGSVAPLNPAEGQPGGRLGQTLAEVESERMTAEQLLTHLRREQQRATTERPISEEDLALAFEADPDVASVEARLRESQGRLHSIQRLSRRPGDPSVVNAKKRVEALEAERSQLWRERRSSLAAALARESSAEISAAVSRAEADLVTLKAREAALRERQEQAANEQLQRLRQDRDEFARLRGANSPQLRAIDEQIARLEGRRDHPSALGLGKGKNAAVLDSITLSLKSIEAMRNDLQKKFDEDLNASKKTEISQLQEMNLRNNLERQRTLFYSVVDQLKQAQLVSDFGSVSAQTINPPVVAAEKPNLFLVLGMAVFGGCALGTLAAFGVDLLDARVRTLAEIRKLVDLPVIGLIPQLPPAEFAAVGSVGLLSHELPRSALAESYKSTRTNLEFLRRNRKAQVLLITSPHPGDGKSTTASNLAITLAHAGRRILLIDADLRKPSQHAIYNVSRDYGLSDALSAGSSPSMFAQPTVIENLDLLTTGPSVTNPAELLASNRLAEFLDEARQTYDVVIVDSSPLLAVTDPSIIAAVVDGIILVVRVVSTRRYDIDRTLELLKTLAIPVLGMVVNGITRDQIGYGYGYGYGYGGYGQYGYGRYGQVYGANGTNGDSEHHANGNGASNGNGTGNGKKTRTVGVSNGVNRRIELGPGASGPAEPG